MEEIIIATKNKGKLREFTRMLSPLGYSVISAEEAGFTDEIEETGATFAENAALKARAIAKACGKAAIGDDSGLCVDALGGAPGVYSARYAGDGHDDEANIVKLLKNMRDVPDGARAAHFECAIVCAFPNGDEICARGVCDGEILREKRGEGGFGYDPIFGVSCGKSFGELSPEEKDEISHRGRALRELVKLLSEKDK